MAAMVILELAVVLMHIVAISESAECNGCVVLDSKTFDRVLNKFDVMLVKFDKHDPDVQKQAVFDQIYNDLSKEYGMEDMMTAHVDIVKNGEARNQELASKYGLENELLDDKSLPAIFLFFRKKNEENATHEHFRLKDHKDISVGVEGDQKGINLESLEVDMFKRQIRILTGIYFTLPGCLDDFDFIAIKFAGEFTKFKKESILAEAKAKLIKLSADETIKREIGQAYIEWMVKANDSGEDTNRFIAQEMTNIFEKINKPNEMSEEQAKKLNQALNILDSFQLAGRFQMVEAPEHDEL